VVPSLTRRTGWRFSTKDEKEPGDNTTPDPLHDGFTHLRDIYFDTEKDYSGRFTVPTLYDKKQMKIVNNESSEIIRMFYHVFDDLLPDKYKKLDLLPDDLKEEIEQTNEWTYNDINNGITHLPYHGFEVLTLRRCIQERLCYVGTNSLVLYRETNETTARKKHTKRPSPSCSSHSTGRRSTSPSPLVHTITETE
jgi:hypothetical protein